MTTPERPLYFNDMLKIYEDIKKLPPDQPVSTYANAIILVVEFQLALEKGNVKHYDSNGNELKTLPEILQVLRDGKQLLVEKKNE